MENLAVIEQLQEELKNKIQAEPRKVEERISSIFHNIYQDVKNLNEAYLEDTKVEAGGE